MSYGTEVWSGDTAHWGPESNWFDKMFVLAGRLCASCLHIWAAVEIAEAPRIFKHEWQADVR